MLPHRYLTAVVALGLAAWCAGPAAAQDLEPRAFSPAPVGMNFGVLNYGYSEGNVFFDQALPAEDAFGKVHTAAAAYVRTIDVLGATGKAAVAIPFAWGDWVGLWQGAHATTSRRGFADPTVSLAVNFIGAPARTLQELGGYSEGTVVGASVLAIVPLGEYDPARLINLGSNRWSLRTRLGASRRVGRWTFEIIGGVWLFTDNTEAFGGVNVAQDPLWAAQVSATYLFKRGFWGAVGIGGSSGGRTVVDGVTKDTLQENERFGAVLVIPLNRRHSIKASWISSVATRVGADFDRFNLAWQVRWGGGI